jgi:hypothetical protein
MIGGRFRYAIAVIGSELYALPFGSLNASLASERHLAASIRPVRA